MLPCFLVAGLPDPPRVFSEELNVPNPLPATIATISSLPEFSCQYSHRKNKHTRFVQVIFASQIDNQLICLPLASSHRRYKNQWRNLCFKQHIINKDISEQAMFYLAQPNKIYLYVCVSYFHILEKVKAKMKIFLSFLFAPSKG
jgi:hypothetical protein